MKKIKKVIKNKKKIATKIPFRFKVDKRAKKILIFAFIVVIGGLLFYRVKQYFIVALVGRQPITRHAFVKELEKQGGKMVLEDIISQKLVRMEAENSGASVSATDLREEILEIEKQLSATGQDLDSVLKLQGQTRADLMERIELQKLLEELLGKDVVVTDEEIEAYFEENVEFFPEETTIESVKEDITNQLRSQKIAEKYPEWLKSLKAKYQIRYFTNY